MSRLVVKACLARVEFVVVAVMLVGCNSGWNDQVSVSKYSNLAEAVRSNAVAKGWIPELLPKSATNIIEWHNVEIDRLRVEFSFDAKADGQWIEALFKRVTDSRAEILKRGLLQSRGATIRSREKLWFYELSEPKTEYGYLVVNYDQGRAQYWTQAK